jgi:hypothetical protein
MTNGLVQEASSITAKRTTESGVVLMERNPTKVSTSNGTGFPSSDVQTSDVNV